VWRLPPIARVAQLALDAQRPPHTPLTRTVAVEYPRRSQRVDLVFG
jgi:hypothetical protein